MRIRHRNEQEIARQELLRVCILSIAAKKQQQQQMLVTVQNSAYTCTSIVHVSVLYVYTHIYMSILHVIYNY